MWTRSGRVAAISIVLVLGCGSDCKVENVEYTKSLNTVGYAGATQGVPIARFDLTQNFVTHTPYEACAQGPLQDVGVVVLSITSVAPAPVFIKYDVQGLDAAGIPVWSYADTVGFILAPNRTIAIGEITTSTQALGAGGARVLLQAAELVP